MTKSRERGEAGDFVAVGRVTASQGNRGEVRVLPFTDFPQQFSPGSRLRALKGDTESFLEVESVRQHKGFIVLGFSGIQCIDHANALRGAILEVPRRELITLPEGHYYAFEIEGLKVVTTEGRHLGKVVRVISGPANDVYEVSCEHKSGRKKNVLIPAVKEIVKGVDLELGQIIVDLIPGLE